MPSLSWGLHVPSPLLFPALGLAAGAITTIAGQGGGLLLLLVCALLVGPHEALALTAPALLLGNLHRALLLRAHLDRGVAARMIAGALPGGLAGGLLAGSIPPWFLRGLLVALTLLAIAKAAGKLRLHVPTPALLPAGALVGLLTGAGGGAGILFAPILLASGLTGNVFVATSATIAFATHAGRVVGYASLGLFDRSLFGPTVAVTLAIFAGNWLASRRKIQAGLDALGRGRGRERLEYGMLVVSVVLSVAGLG
jgi:uncharacterized membrane protein YfcA